MATVGRGGGEWGVSAPGMLMWERGGSTEEWGSKKKKKHPHMNR